MHPYPSGETSRQLLLSLFGRKNANQSITLVRFAKLIHQKTYLEHMELNALYYPYVSPHSLDVLKILSMYFDKINFLSPEFIYSGYDEDRHAVVKALGELRSRGLVGLVRPGNIVSMYHEVLDSLIQNDITGKIFSVLSRRPWNLYVEKVPEETLNRYFRGTRKGKTVKVPFELGESVIVNLLILSCSSFNLSPLTDEMIHFKALKRKINAIMRAFGIGEAPSFSIKIKLPSIAGLPFADTIAYIDEDSNALKRARKSIRKLVDRLADGCFDGNSPFWICSMLEEIEARLTSIRTDLNQTCQRRGESSIVVEVPAIMEVYVSNSWKTLLQKASCLTGWPASSVQRVPHRSGKYENAVSFFVDPRYLLPDRGAISQPSKIIKGLTRDSKRIVQAGSATMDELLNSLNLREGPSL